MLGEERNSSLRLTVTKRFPNNRLPKKLDTNSRFYDLISLSKHPTEVGYETLGEAEKGSFGMGVWEQS